LNCARFALDVCVADSCCICAPFVHALTHMSIGVPGMNSDMIRRLEAESQWLSSGQVRAVLHSVGVVRAVLHS
jgi:hypothetical protein